MDKLSPFARVCAGAVALAAWAGLLVQVQASIGLTGSAPAAIWAMLRYFTVLTNLLVALVFTALALWSGRGPGPSLIGGTTLSIALVGVIYALLLRDLLDLSGGAKLADILLHHVTPVAAPLYWLGFAPKGRLTRADPWRWTLYPLAYFGYALVRGALDGAYPYPFMDVGQIGWAHTGVNAVFIALGFIVAGLVMLWLDGRLAPRLAEDA
jgi:hypothetical protein